MVERVFIALPVNCPAASLLDMGITDCINNGLHPVAEENLHITIAYLGTVKEEQLGKLQRQLSALAAYIPTVLEVAKIKNFPKRNSPLIVGLVAHCFELQQLHEATLRLLESLSISVDLKNRFTPHITLGRVVKSGEITCDITLTPAIAIRPTILGLYHGMQTSLGYRYQSLFSIDRNAGSSSS